MRQWRTFRDVPLDIEVRWEWLLASGALVLLTYGLLIQTWRWMMSTWGAHLPFWTATRIWMVSNLGNYLPAKQAVQIGAMSWLAQQAGISPTAAAGTAVLNTLVNIAVGLALAIGLGWRELDVLAQGHAAIGIILLAAMALGLATLPYTMPAVLGFTARTTGKALDVGPIPHRAVVIAIGANLVAWILYGVAFQWMVLGILGSAPGGVVAYVTVYAASYVIGYLIFFLPAGIGAREGAMLAALPVIGLAAGAPALLITVGSRLWITVLQVLPGVLFLARRGRPGSS